MAAPFRLATGGPRRRRTPELELLESPGATVAARAGAPRLRVAGTPELVVDDLHPDFSDLPRFRG